MRDSVFLALHTHSFQCHWFSRVSHFCPLSLPFVYRLPSPFFPHHQAPSSNLSGGFGFDADMLSAESLQLLLAQLNLGADAFAPDSVASPGEGPQ